MSGMDPDEELAMALFHQFAEELEAQLKKPIPDHIKRDPVAYQQFIATEMEKLSSGGGGGGGRDHELTRRAECLFASNPLFEQQAAQSSGGKQGFLDRLKRGDLFKRQAKPITGTSTRVRVVAVGGGSSGDNKRTSLLSDQDAI